MKSIFPIVAFLILTISASSQNQAQEFNKIKTFCQVWGFLKYYHPTVAKGKIDWDQEFIKRLDTVILLGSKQEISEYYFNWITSLGFIKTSQNEKHDLTGLLKSNLNFEWINDTIVFTHSLIDRLEFIRVHSYRGKNHYVQQDKQIGKTVFDHEKPYQDSIFPSPEMRLLGLSRYWNIINYFFPYKYLIGQDWNEVLLEMIPKFKYPNDTLAYHLAMLELTAKLKDNHAGILTEFTSSFLGRKWAPFSFKIINNKAIVTGFYSDSLCRKNDIQFGDVFLKVGEQTIEELILEKSRYIASSNQSTLIRNMYYCTFNGSSDSILTRYERNGIVREKYLHRYPFEQFEIKGNTNKKPFRVLEGNIGYLNLGMLRPMDIKYYLDSIKNTKALVIDIRNYPNGTLYKLANFLLPAKRPFVKFTQADLSNPGYFSFTQPYTCGRKNKKAYQGKVVLLFNENSQSHAEFTIMALQTVPNVICIGSETAGADGNVSVFTFPGNYKTYFTGIGVYYPDGKETQRIGIAPNIRVVPTLEGIKLKKDEILEKALELLNSN